MDYNIYLTTIDNPFDPFDDFVNWLLFDNEKGYNCCGKLVREMKIEDDFTQKEIDEETERAIDRIIEKDFLQIYKKLKKPLISNEDTTIEENI